jgi:ABC-type transport system involved in cytochrome c biogenesis permease subunit
VQKQHTQLAGTVKTEAEKASLEQHFNQAAPFYLCTVMYLMIVVLGIVCWILSIFKSSGWAEQFRVSAFWLLLLTVVVHTFALIARMHIMGRPPVTNLYSSAVFIGWGCVLVGIVMEKIHPYAIATVTGSFIGFLTMIIAHHLASSGDTMEVMQAVLDTNFWLATHVVIVTLGYMATLFAAVLGMIYIFGGVFTDALRGPFAQILSKMIYGIVCFAMLLSFVGTVLGGIWADQSWGRFWGWDPKENGAVMVVVWNAIILHARWGGMIKQRGLAICAVLGAMVVGWSWFGTNQLGIGLHAYGFNNTLAVGLTVVWAGLLGIVGLGFLPAHYWKSFAPALPAPVQEYTPKSGGRGKKRGR